MFKKIEMWILYLAILCSILFAIFFGVLVRQELVGTVKLGHISKFAVFLSEIPMNVKKIFQVAKDPGIERSVGAHFEGKYGFVGEHKRDGIFLLLSRYDGDIKEAVVELIELKGFKLIHRWNPDVKLINDRIDTNREEYKLLNRDFHENRYKIDSPILDNDGSLIIHPNGSALVKIDSCNDIVWINDEDHFHHMGQLDNEGNLWIPSSIFPYSIDEKIVGKKYGDFMDDAITKISSEGNIIFQKSVLQIFLDNNLESLFFSNQIFDGDPIHLNDIQPVSSDSKFWKKGDLFLSLRTPNMIMQYRPKNNKIINMITGPFINQHDVDIISKKEISIFNNNLYYFKGPRVDGGNLHFDGIHELRNAEVIIYDFEKKRFRKKFEDSMILHNVQTSVQGLSEIMDDGSLFVEETQRGRLLFFDNKGDLQWEYINKAKNSKNYALGFSKILYSNKILLNSIKKLKNKQCKY